MKAADYEGGEVMSEWISVEDRLPEKDNCYVIAACEGGNVDKTFYSKNREFFRLRATSSYSRRNQGKASGYFELSHEYGYKVTHWMPLPEPPK